MKQEYTEEEIYSRAHTEIRNLESALNGFAGQEKNLESLFGWYFNGCWMKDYDLDEKGLLSSDLKRGVLSEDTIDPHGNRGNSEKKQRNSRINHQTGAYEICSGFFWMEGNPAG